MRIIALNVNNCSPPRRQRFSRNIIQDYETSEGIVREISNPNKKPRYKLLKTKESINVEFINPQKL